MIKLELPEQMVLLIANVLRDQPYKLVCDVLTEMQRQITEQRQPKGDDNG